MPAFGVRLQAAARLPAVLVDKIQIQQVIVNPMRNAVEAMEHSPRRELTVTAEQTADARQIIVRIVDTGPGLAPKAAERLFEPFVTVRNMPRDDRVADREPPIPRAGRYSRSPSRWRTATWHRPRRARQARHACP